MELHDNLKALGEQLGPTVFDDPDSFRGALDDFLDEDAASTGDINLLVDAVRLGAYRSMRTMLDSGAEAGAAIEEAGARLARDRGSADLAGSQWACAVLGYAVGKVGEADVRRYRSQGAPGSMTQQPGQPGTQLPPTAMPQMPAPQAPPGPQTPPTQQPAPPIASPAPSFPAPADPTAFSPQVSAPVGPPQTPGSWPSSGQNPGAPQPQSWGTPAPAKKKTGMIIGVVVAAVVVIAGGVGLAVALGGGDDKGGKGKDGGDPTSTSTGSGLDFSAIDQRYLGLGASVTSPVSDCHDGGAEGQIAERIECEVDGGTLTLTTYTDQASLDAARDEVVDLSERGGVYLKTGPDVVYGFDAAEDDADSTDANYLYWDDDHAFQSGLLEASDASTSLASLNQLRIAAGSTLPYGTRPTDGQLIAFVNRLSQSTTCERIPTKAAGETEENHCDGPKNISVYYGRFADRASFETYRKGRDQTATGNGAEPDTWHFQSDTDKEIGKLDQYILNKGTSDAQAVLYWDDDRCLCYGEAYRPGNVLKPLYDWWAKG